MAGVFGVRKHTTLVYGMGVNDVDYVTETRLTTILPNGKRKSKVVWICPYYTRWKNMLRRCYCTGESRYLPTYIEAKVCDTWLSLSNFKTWMETQNWQGLQLDKDILIRGNKTYSPDTCAFVPSYINKLLLVRENDRGPYPLGVSKESVPKDMMKPLNKPFTSHLRSLKLGRFATPEEAHRAWQLAKADSIEISVSQWREESSYRLDVAGSLLERVIQLRTHAENRVETTFL